MSSKWWVVAIAFFLIITPFASGATRTLTADCVPRVSPFTSAILDYSCEPSGTACGITYLEDRPFGNLRDQVEPHRNTMNCPALHTCELKANGEPQCTYTYEVDEGRDQGDWKWITFGRHENNGAVISHDPIVYVDNNWGSATGDLRAATNILYVWKNKQKDRQRSRVALFWGYVDENTVVPVKTSQKIDDAFFIDVYHQSGAHVCDIQGGLMFGNSYLNKVFNLGQSGPGNVAGSGASGDIHFCEGSDYLTPEGFKPGWYLFVFHVFDKSNSKGNGEWKVSLDFTKPVYDIFYTINSQDPRSLNLIDGDLTQEACEGLEGTDWLEGASPNACCGDDLSDQSDVSTDGKNICVQYAENYWSWYEGNEALPDPFTPHTIYPDFSGPLQQDVVSNGKEFYACTLDGIALSGANALEPGESLPATHDDGLYRCNEFLGMPSCGDGLTISCCRDNAKFGSRAEFINVCEDACYNEFGEKYSTVGPPGICELEIALPLCDEGTGGTGEGDYLPEELCVGEYARVDQCFDIDLDPNLPCVQQAENSGYAQDKFSVCEGDAYVCEGTLVVSTEDGQKARQCCLGAGECTAYDNDMSCEENKGIVYNPDEQECFGYDTQVGGEECCFGTPVSTGLGLDINTPESFLCYEAQNTPYFAECCSNKGCFNAGDKNYLDASYNGFYEWQLELSDTRTYQSGNNLHVVDDTDRTWGEAGRRVLRIIADTPTECTFNFDLCSKGVGTRFGARNWEGFEFLELDFAVNRKEELQHVYLIDGQNELRLLGELTQLVDTKVENQWQHIILPLPPVDLQGNNIDYSNIKEVGFTYKGDYDQYTPLEYLINNVFLSGGLSTENYVCSGYSGTWLKDVDPPAEAEDTKAYQYACNDQSYLAWTGSRCCGDDRTLQALDQEAIELSGSGELVEDSGFDNPTVWNIEVGTESLVVIEDGVLRASGQEFTVTQSSIPVTLKGPAVALQFSIKAQGFTTFNPNKKWGSVTYVFNYEDGTDYREYFTGDLKDINGFGLNFFTLPEEPVTVEIPRYEEVVTMDVIIQSRHADSVTVDAVHAINSWGAQANDAEIVTIHEIPSFSASDWELRCQNGLGTPSCEAKTPQITEGALQMMSVPTVDSRATTRASYNTIVEVPKSIFAGVETNKVPITMTLTASKTGGNNAYWQGTWINGDESLRVRADLTCDDAENVYEDIRYFDFKKEQVTTTPSSVSLTKEFNLEYFDEFGTQKDHSIADCTRPIMTLSVSHVHKSDVAYTLQGLKIEGYALPSDYFELSEFYPDSNAACVESTYVPDGMSVGEATQNYLDYGGLYFDTENNFVECVPFDEAKFNNRYNDYFVDINGIGKSLGVLGVDVNVPLVNNKRGLCAELGKYYCSPDGNWERQDDLKLFTVRYDDLYDLPSGGRGPQIKDPNTGDIEDPGARPMTIFCSEGEWKEAVESDDWYGNTTGLCPDVYCHCPYDECKQDYDYVSGASSTCLRDGGFLTDATGADRMCQAGTWTSRTALVGQKLDSIATGDYTLHCDVAQRALTESVGLGTACVLATDSDHVVGVPLTTSPETFITQNIENLRGVINFSEFTNTTCNDAAENDSLYRCGDSEEPYLYYDAQFNIVYVSTKTIDFDGNVLSAIVDWIRGFFGGSTQPVSKQFTHAFIADRDGKKISAYKQIIAPQGSIVTSETYRFQDYGSKPFSDVNEYRQKLGGDTNELTGTADDFTLTLVHPDPDPWSVLTSSTR